MPVLLTGLLLAKAQLGLIAISSSQQSSRIKSGSSHHTAAGTHPLSCSPEPAAVSRQLVRPLWRRQRRPLPHQQPMLLLLLQQRLLWRGCSCRWQG